MREVLEILKKIYLIKSLELKEKVQLGYLSNNFILENHNSKYFLKEYRIKEKNRIEEIHASKFFFAEGEIPVILPLKQIDGSTFCLSGDRYYALFPFIEGRIIRRADRSRKAIKSAGMMLGKIHLLSREKIPPSIKKISKTWNRDQFLKEKNFIHHKILEIPTRTSFDELALKTIQLKTSIVEKNQLNFTDLGLDNDHLIHGDYHGLNIFFDKNDEVQFIFDFEKTELAPRSYEIIRAIDFMCFSNQYDENTFEAARIFLSGYQEIYPITQEELRKGFNFYYLKKAHSLWLETEHYLENNHRTDHFLEIEFKMLNYYKNGF